MEDNDFAAGLNNCITKDGLSVPTSPLTWGLTSQQMLALTRGSDGVIFSAGRSGGGNNPALQISATDSTGIALNLTTAQQLALAINGTNAVTITAGAVLIPNGTSSSPSLAFSSESGTGFFRAAATDLGLSIGGTKFWDFLNTPPYAKLVAPNGMIRLQDTGASGSILEIQAINGAAILNANWITTPTPLSLRINGAEALGIATTGAITVAAPTGSNFATTINGAANSAAINILGNSTSGQSMGLRMLAGTSSADLALNIGSQSGATQLLSLAGDGEFLMGVPPAVTLQSSTLFQVGYMDEPQNIQNANYGLAITDRGKQIYHSSGSAHTYTIPANGSVAFPIGTIIRIINDVGGGALTIAITTDTLVWAPSGGTGSRTLTAFGLATIEKKTATSWAISGANLT